MAGAEIETDKNTILANESLTDSAGIKCGGGADLEQGDLTAPLLQAQTGEGDSSTAKVSESLSFRSWSKKTVSNFEGNGDIDDGMIFQKTIMDRRGSFFPASTSPLPAASPLRTPSREPSRSMSTDSEVSEVIPVNTGPGSEVFKPSASQRLMRGAVCGAINGTVTIPVMMSFTAIIFQHPVYHPWMNQLVKLVTLSSALHQLVFSFRSTLPFAVGQVQDVGLIFLSAMATTIANACGEQGAPAAEALATTLFCVCISTLLVGLAIIVTGKLKLAQLVQYVPLPVVGGYLGYVGYFCLVSGITLASGVHVSTPATWLHLCNQRALMHLAPAIAAWLTLHFTLRSIRHPLALPAMLCVLPLTFYAALWALGVSLEEAQNNGWATKPHGGVSPHFWEVWGLYNWQHLTDGGVHWRLIPQQGALLAALFFVVAFGSSMDVAAIQQDVSEPLDYNKELVTVGVSNFVTGLVGCGFTGSYIFSQTVFSLRMKVDTRANGLVIALMELTMFALPFDVIQYFPSYFFGGLMIWIGVDIAKDWLVVSYHKVRDVEFVLLWITFLLIWWLGLELGITAGIVLACLNFSVSYAKVHVHAFAVVPSRSGFVRPYEERSLLELLATRITAVSLSGYIFFGSSIKISDKVLQVADLLLKSDEKLPSMRRGRMPSDFTLSELEVTRMDTFQSTLGKLPDGMRQRTKVALPDFPRFVLLDFRRVNGLDATAARTFATLVARLAHMGIELVITHISTGKNEIKSLLFAHGVIGGEGHVGCRSFPTMDAGMSYCEEQLLEYARQRGLIAPPPQSVQLSQVLRANIEQPHLLLPGDLDYQQLASELKEYLTDREFVAGGVVFDLGDPGDTLFFLERGGMRAQMLFSGVRVRQEGHVPKSMKGMQREEWIREFTFGPGAIFGEMDFFLQRPRTFRAVATTSVSVWCLSRDAYERLAQEVPHLLNVIQAIVLRMACLSLSHTVEVLEKANLE